MSIATTSLPHPLAQAKQSWRLSGWRTRLTGIYAALPETNCARRGACCGLLPPMQPVEMLAWLCEQDQMDKETSGARAVDLARHFLLNAVRRLPCPWALEKSCARYEGRFFGCRVYGLWTREAYGPRRRQSIEAAWTVRRAWQSMGISLPTKVCAPPPPYCDQVEPVSGPLVDDEKLDELESDLAGLGHEEPWHGYLSQCGGDLSYLVAALALGWQECLQAKVEVTRALLAGEEKSAENILAQADQKARLWINELVDSLS